MPSKDLPILSRFIDHASLEMMTPNVLTECGSSLHLCNEDLQRRVILLCIVGYKMLATTVSAIDGYVQKSIVILALKKRTSSGYTFI